MALEISTVGAKVLYAVETTAGTRPTTNYTVIPDVSEAPEFDMSLEVLDASNITDAVTRYIPGRQDPGGDKAFTLNHTDAVITAWDTLVSAAETAWASGKSVWFEYQYPNSAKSYFWSGIPKALGSSGIAQNEVSKIPAHVAVTGWAGWAAKSTTSP